MFVYRKKAGADNGAQEGMGKISKYLIGGNMAMVFDVYCDMEEDVKPYRAIE